MSVQTPFLLQALGLAALLGASPGAAAGQASRPADRPPVRVYTNDDLDRVHPFAAETGVRSVPAVPTDAARETPHESRAARGRGEAHWRREAAAVRERLRALEERAEALRARIAERVATAPVYGRSSASSEKGSIATLRASLLALERRMRRTQEDLADRARRDGALPGWLR